MLALPPADQKRGRPLFLSLLAKRRAEIEASSLPLLAKKGRDFETPSSHVLSKKEAGFESLLPSPWGQRGRGIRTTHSLPSSPPLDFPVSLIPSLGHEPSLCPP